MKFGSIWQRLRSSFANSAGTIVFGMEDDAKTVLIAGPPVPSPPPVAAVPVPPPGAANVPPPPPPPPSLPLFQGTRFDADGRWVSWSCMDILLGY